MQELANALLFVFSGSFRAHLVTEDPATLLAFASLGGVSGSLIRRLGLGALLKAARALGAHEATPAVGTLIARGWRAWAIQLGANQTIEVATSPSGLGTVIRIAGTAPAPAVGGRVAVVGSREFSHPELVTRYVNQLDSTTTLVSGGARGVDSIGQAAANARGLATNIIPAEWTRLGRSAGMTRNTQIVNASDRVVAFWDGVSSGTRDTITKAIAAGKDVEVYIYR